MSISPSFLKDLILKKNKRVKTLMCSIFWSLLFLFNRCWWVFFGWGTCSPHTSLWLLNVFIPKSLFFATPVPWHFLSAVPSLGFGKQPHGKSISNTMAYSYSWVSKWVLSWKLKKMVYTVYHIYVICQWGGFAKYAMVNQCFRSWDVDPPKTWTSRRMGR